MEIIAIVNPKGGVGKTTTAINLAAVLAKRGERVLLIDTDFQMNVSLSLGIKKFEYNLYHAFLGKKSFKEIIVSTNCFDVIPSNIGLLRVEPESMNLEEIKRLPYDYIIIDTPPSLSAITSYVLKISTSILIPFQVDFLSFESLKNFIFTISLVNHTEKIKGILPTMFVKNSNLSKQVLADIKKEFGKYLFWESEERALLIPRSLKVSESISFYRPIIHYKPDNSVSKAYKKLGEFI